MNLRPERNNARTPRTVLMLLTNSYDPDPRVRQEAVALIGMGCRVKLLAWDRDLKSAAFENMEGVEVERVFLTSKHGRGNTQLFFYALLYLRLLWRAWRIPFDAIHCHDLDTLPLGFVVGKLKRKPIVYDAHESFPDMLDGRVHRLVKAALVRLENFFIRRVDLLITVGEKLRNYFDERGARHSAVVGNWKCLEEFAKTDAQNLEVRTRLGIPADAMVVVCITQLLTDRKLEELLEAVEERSDTHLIIGGVGVLETMVRESAARNPRIHYVGFVPGREIPSYTCASDVVYYGFDPQNPNAKYSAPNKLFEALAAGRPLITGDFGEIADVVRRSGCGLILPEYSVGAIQEALAALRDVKVRTTLTRRALQYGNAVMNWEKGRQTLYSEYSELLPNALSWPASKKPASTAVGNTVRMTAGA